MRILYFFIALAVLLAVWSVTAERKSEGQPRDVIQASSTFVVPLSPKERRLVNNLKPGQVAVKTVIFAADEKTASAGQNCCPTGKCCCTCQCDPKPCVCTCTDEIIVK